MITAETSSGVEAVDSRIQPGRMREARGDILRIADSNMQLPDGDEVGLFAVPIHVASTGEFSWALVDGDSEILVVRPILEHLILWVVKNYNEKATLTDVARALI